MPAIHAIRREYPQAALHLLTNTGHAGQKLVSLDQLLPGQLFERVINYQGSSRRHLIHKIREQRYDAVIQLPQYSAPWHRLLRDLLVFRLLCRIPSGIGWQWDHIPLFTRAQEAGQLATDERSRLLQILARNGLQTAPETAVRPYISAADRETADALLRAHVPQGKPLIGLVIGAKRSQNRWPLEYFGEVCEYFSPSYEIVVIGGPDDHPLARILEERQSVHSLCGLLTPLQNAHVLQQCRVVLSNDTGPMHLAYFMGTPLVALFSARDLPGRWYPPQDENNIVLRTFGLPCATCFSETCADNICMKHIRPAAAITALRELLNR